MLGSLRWEKANVRRITVRELVPGHLGGQKALRPVARLSSFLGEWDCLFRGTAMSDSAQITAGNTAPPPIPNKSATSNTGSSRAMMIGIVGVLLVLAAAGAVAVKSDFSFSTVSSNETTVTFVDPRDLNDAAGTLAQSVAGGLVADARRCRIPLVSMTIAKGTAQTGSTLRIRSGGYVSPFFTVTEGMQRIAVPYPAPYGTGAGTFVVEGNATGAVLGLTPTKVLLDLPTAQSIPVVWRAVSPCERSTSR
jgi:hypothetical protein